jgi:hypothetical protein
VLTLFIPTLSDQAKVWPPAGPLEAKLLPDLKEWVWQTGLKKQSWLNLKPKANVICPEERGAKRICNLLSRWHTLPPEACFSHPL